MGSKKIVIKGVLEPFCETGTEGVLWAVQEDGKDGYKGLNIIDGGDYLTIYTESGGAILFMGEIRPDYNAGWTEYPHNPGHGQPSALGYRIHWTQAGWNPDDWANFFIRKEGEPSLRAELIKNKKRKVK